MFLKFSQEDPRHFYREVPPPPLQEYVVEQKSILKWLRNDPLTDPGTTTSCNEVANNSFSSFKTVFLTRDRSNNVFKRGLTSKIVYNDGRRRTRLPLVELYFWRHSSASTSITTGDYFSACMILSGRASFARRKRSQRRGARKKRLFSQARIMSTV